MGAIPTWIPCTRSTTRCLALDFNRFCAFVFCFPPDFTFYFIIPLCSLKIHDPLHVTPLPCPVGRRRQVHPVLSSHDTLTIDVSPYIPCSRLNAPHPTLSHIDHGLRPVCIFLDGVLFIPYSGLHPHCRALWASSPFFHIYIWAYCTSIWHSMGAAVIPFAFAGRTGIDLGFLGFVSIWIWDWDWDGGLGQGFLVLSLLSLRIKS